MGGTCSIHGRIRNTYTILVSDWKESKASVLIECQDQNNSKNQCPWESDISIGSQYISHILWYQTLHHCSHSSPPPNTAPLQSQQPTTKHCTIAVTAAHHWTLHHCSHSSPPPNTAPLQSQQPTTFLYPELNKSSPCPPITFKIYLVFFHLCLGISSVLFPSGFQIETCIDIFSPTPATYPAHLIPLTFDHLNNISRGVQMMQLLMTQTCPVCCYCLPPRPNYIPQHTVSLCSLVNIRDQVPHLYETTGSIYLCI